MSVAVKKYKNELIERTILYSKRIVKLVRLLSKNREFWIICDQLVRSGTSIGANIVEAQETTSRKDFGRFISYALKSADETWYWLELIEVSGDVRVEVEYLQSETKELSKILKSIIKKLRQ